MSMRHYLFPDDSDPLRLSQRLVNNLIRGGDALPQFANTRQRVAGVILSIEGGKPQEIVGIEGTIWKFDDNGRIDHGLSDALALAMDSLPDFRSGGTVVALQPRRSKKALDNEYRWTPSPAEVDRIVADIWPKRKEDRLKALGGHAQQSPRMTFEAKHVLNQIEPLFWDVARQIEMLKDPSLKALAFQVRQRAISDPDYAPLYRAAAELADHQLELSRRRRTGKGIWYAVVEIMAWKDGVGEAVERYFERCSSRAAAVSAARRLMAEHVHKFDAEVTVEAELLTDLEWERRGLEA